jgi:hypothetical protein
MHFMLCFSQLEISAECSFVTRQSAQSPALSGARSAGPVSTSIQYLKQPEVSHDTG